MIDALRERLTALWLRVRAATRQRQWDRDIDDELAFHLAMRENARREEGLPPNDAKVQARRQFGSPVHVKESLYELWHWRFLERLWQDTRFAARSARRQPAFTTVVILTLALGIGATSAMFSIVDAALLRPFPFAEVDRLVMVWETNRDRDIHTFTGSIANFVDWQQRSSEFAELAAWEQRNDNRTDGPEPEQVQGALATSSFFRALRLQPVVGRFFEMDEDLSGNHFVAVLGYEYWQRAFARDPGVIGRPLTVNGAQYTVVGVLPPLGNPFKADIWRPMAPDVSALDRGDHSAFVVGRLADQASMASAEAQLQATAVRIAEIYPESNRGWSVRVESLYDALVQSTTRRALLVLLGAVALLLLIACVNVANLILARATVRYRELSTRLALGAGRSRVVQQLLTESALLACLGGAAGLLVAAWGLRLVQAFSPADVPGLASAEINPLVVAFAFVVSLVTTVAVGLVPAVHLSRISFAGGLNHSARANTEPPRARRMRHALVVAEIALALVLLVGAGLLLRSVNRLRNTPLGFVPEQVLSAKIGLYGAKYDSLESYVSFIERLLNALERQPGIVAKGLASSVPFGGGYTVMQVRLDGDQAARLPNGLQSGWRVIAGDYFSTIGIPLVAGRPFNNADDHRVPRVAMISQGLADQLWPGQDAVGRQMLVGDARRPYRIVGVVGQSRLTMLGRDAEVAMYFHYRQFGWQSMTIVARAAGDPAALASVIRAAVSETDREQPIFDVHPMRDLVTRAAAAPAMNAWLLTLFAGLALTLAAIGVYGVMSYSAAQRTNEIGLRVALGARPRDVRRLLWRNGLVLTAAGLSIGLIASLVAGRALSSLVYEVSTRDPATYLAGVGVMLVVAMAACYAPARRAMKIDPVVALRHE